MSATAPRSAGGLSPLQSAATSLTGISELPHPRFEHASESHTLRFLGDSILRDIAKPVDDLAEVTPSLLRAMRRELRAGGVGIAAPQLGVSLRVIVLKYGRSNEFHAYLNPRIVAHSVEMADSVGEGCLSIPGFRFTMRRHAHVQVALEDLQGKVCRRNASGLEAFAFQHEIEHLDGKLLVDRVGVERRREAERVVAAHLEKIQNLQKLQNLQKSAVVAGGV